MSMLMRNPEFGPRALQIQWINCIVTTHGMICSCEKPFHHLQDLLKDQQVKCHFTGDPNTDGAAAITTGNGEDHFDEGDLDRLFEEDFTEDDG